MSCVLQYRPSVYLPCPPACDDYATPISPDFAAWCLNNISINTNGNGHLSHDEVIAVTIMSANNESLDGLAGIEYFKILL